MAFNQFSTDNWQSDQMQEDAENFDPNTNPQNNSSDIVPQIYFQGENMATDPEEYQPKDSQDPQEYRGQPDPRDQRSETDVEEERPR